MGALLMSPSYSHERLKERLGMFVMVVVDELDIPCIAAGSTTFRRRQARRRRGRSDVLPRERGRVRGKKKIDLRRDPPPDLAIEVVCTHDADERVEVYRRLGVPEVWVCDRIG